MMDQCGASPLRAEIVGWLLDLDWLRRGCSAEDVAQWAAGQSDDALIEMVDRWYEGGWVAFVLGAMPR